MFCSEKEFSCRRLDVQTPVAINRQYMDAVKTGCTSSLRWRLAIRGEHSWITTNQSSLKRMKRIVHTQHRSNCNNIRNRRIGGTWLAAARAVYSGILTPPDNCQRLHIIFFWYKMDDKADDFIWENISSITYVIMLYFNGFKYKPNKILG